MSMYFFFSSRRRHTRCSRDWSSDVCSSDLGKRHGLELLGDLLGTRRVVVVEANEICAFDLLEEPDVVETQRACPDHTHTHRSQVGAWLHTITPRCDASMKRRNVSTSGTWGSSVRERATPWLTVRSELNTSR